MQSAEKKGTMRRKFVDLSVYEAKMMSKDGNINTGYWFNRTMEDRLAGAARMIEVAFQEPQFIQKKVDRTVFSVRKHRL